MYTSKLLESKSKVKTLESTNLDDVSKNKDRTIFRDFLNCANQDSCFEEEEVFVLRFISEVYREPVVGKQSENF